MKLKWNNPKFIADYKVSPVDFVLRTFLSQFDNEDKPLRGLIVGFQEESSARILADLGHKILGVDVRADGNIPLSYNSTKTPIQELELHRSRYDFIVCLSTIQYIGRGVYAGDSISENADFGVLAKLSRFLKPSGKLYLSLPIGKGKCPIDGLVYSKDRINTIIPKNLRVEYRQAIYSHYYWTHGESDRVQELDDANAFTAEDFIPEMFFVLIKNKTESKSISKRMAIQSSED